MTTSPLVFVDTETTGLHPDRRAWEIAMIRRDAHGEREVLIQVSDIDLSTAEPMGLKVGGFYERHAGYRPDAEWIGGPNGYPFVEGDPSLWMTEAAAAREVEAMTRGAHLIGAVPDFDARTLDPMLRRHGFVPSWHHHLVDIEALAVGWLSAWAAQPTRYVTGTAPEGVMSQGHGQIWMLPERTEVTSLRELIAPPWRSDDLARACGVEPPSDADRHTAMGDARWVQRWYDTLTGGA